MTPVQGVGDASGDDSGVDIGGLMPLRVPRLILRPLRRRLPPVMLLPTLPPEDVNENWRFSPGTLMIETPLPIFRKRTETIEAGVEPVNIIVTPV